jgi:L-galactose dehydrogenase
MFAVRKALHDPAQLFADLAKIHGLGQGDIPFNALDFLKESGIAATLPEAAYRFCTHTPGISVTLSGTGNYEHLAENLRALSLPPLPDSALERLAELFGNVDCVSGQ